MFVNVCSHPRIDPVVGANLEAVSEEHLDTWGLGNMRVPLLVGPTREMLDSEGHDATAVDVIFHPAVVKRALTGGKSVTKEHYRDYLMDIAVKNILEDHGIMLAPGRTQVMANARYKGPRGENSENTHGFPVFAPEEEEDGRGVDGGRGGDFLNPQLQPKQPNDTTHRSPLIQEIGAAGNDTNGGGSSVDGKIAASGGGNKASGGGSGKGSPFTFGGHKKKKKPIKKGFLGEGELYPDGSAEGIPKPGEQYDPLGHIPESVRSKCHVIDSGALNGADLEAVTQQYAKTGTLDMSKPGVYAKGSKPGERKPGDIGIGHPRALKDTEVGDQGRGKEIGTSQPHAGGGERGGNEGNTEAGSNQQADLRKTPVHEVSAEATLGGEAAVEVRVQLPLLKGGMTAVELDVGPRTMSMHSAEYKLMVQLPHAVDVDAAQAKFSSKRMELKVVMPVAVA